MWIGGTVLLMELPMIASASAQRMAEMRSTLLVPLRRPSRPRKSISSTSLPILLGPARDSRLTRQHLRPIRHLHPPPTTTTTMMMTSQARHPRSRNLHQSALPPPHAPQELPPTTAPQAHPGLHAKRRPDALPQEHHPASALRACPRHPQLLAKPEEHPEVQLLKHRARHPSRPLQLDQPRHLLLAGVRESRSQSSEKSNHAHPYHRG